MSDEARLEKKQRIQENRERRAAAAAAVASVNAALGLGGQMGGSAAVLKHSTEMDQQELALTQQQTRKSIKQVGNIFLTYLYLQLKPLEIEHLNQKKY